MTEQGLEERVELLLARESIRLLNYEYADAIDAGDFDRFSALFEHGTWRGLHGSDAIRKWLDEIVIVYPDGSPRTLHLVSNLSVDISGSEARGRAVITVLQHHPDHGNVEVITVNDYQDLYVKDAGGWRFDVRRISRRLDVDTSRHMRQPRDE
ncbi:nuclear transport factor 2 family protein [Dactylosporangium roseum]|uniref:Nuclear transport factor 2 family protein n=1 Tax=Dactylosporangium roseum TaxID=47989 RepID=A0ABY5YY62_9ACTN|nr:nuclear transport factor 2 family protein [Dactylosporangium roseum]UWZ34472.1 nuclear transport factor 2 family protein [Dactylosporangium roseum]